MPTQAQLLPTFHLTSEDIAKLPSALRKKIEDVRSEKKTALGEWILVGASSDRDARLVDKTMRALPRIASQRRDEITEENIEILITMLLEGEDRTQVDEALLIDNAKLRASYLKTTPTLAGAQVRLLSGLKPKTRANQPHVGSARAVYLQFAMHPLICFPNFSSLMVSHDRSSRRF